MAWTAPRTWTAGELVTAAYMNTHVRDNLTAGFTSAMFGNTTWDCTLKTTGSTGLWNQTVGGDYIRTGPLVHAWGTVAITSLYESSDYTASAPLYLTLPKDLASYVPKTLDVPIGSGYYYDNSAVDTFLLSVVTETSERAIFRWGNAGTTEGLYVNSTNPVSLTSGDRISFHLSYPTTAT